MPMVYRPFSENWIAGMTLASPVSATTKRVPYRPRISIIPYMDVTNFSKRFVVLPLV